MSPSTSERSRRTPPTRPNRSLETGRALGVLGGGLALLLGLVRPLLAHLFRAIMVRTQNRSQLFDILLPPTSWPMTPWWTGCAVFLLGLLFAFTLAPWWWGRWLERDRLKVYQDWALVGGWLGGTAIALVTYVGAVQLIPPIVPHSPIVPGMPVALLMPPAVLLGTALGSVLGLGLRLHWAPAERRAIAAGQGRQRSQRRRQRRSAQALLHHPLVRATLFWMLWWLWLLLWLYPNVGEFWPTSFNHWHSTLRSLVLLGGLWGGTVGFFVGPTWDGGYETSVARLGSILTKALLGSLVAMTSWGLLQILMQLPLPRSLGLLRWVWAYPLYPSLLLGWGTAVLWPVIPRVVISQATSRSSQRPMTLVQGGLMGLGLLASLTLWQAQALWRYLPFTLWDLAAIAFWAAIIGSAVGLIWHGFTRPKPSRGTQVALITAGIYITLQLLQLLVGQWFLRLVSSWLGVDHWVAPTVPLAVWLSFGAQFLQHTTVGAIWGVLGVAAGQRLEPWLEQRFGLAPVLTQPSSRPIDLERPDSELSISELSIADRTDSESPTVSAPTAAAASASTASKHLETAPPTPASLDPKLTAPTVLDSELPNSPPPDTELPEPPKPGRSRQHTARAEADAPPDSALPEPPKPPRSRQGSKAIPPESSPVPQQLLAQAQAGNPAAIAALLNRNLARRGFQVQARQPQAGLLELTLSGSTAPPQTTFLAYLERGLRRLQSPQIQQVQVLVLTPEGQQWQAMIDLTPQ
ncbi:MAG: hypothetical protein ACPGVO_18045 [Spirulinaceae cyanobacterium]